MKNIKFSVKTQVRIATALKFSNFQVKLFQTLIQMEKPFSCVTTIFIFFRRSSMAYVWAMCAFNDDFISVYIFILKFKANIKKKIIFE